MELDALLVITKALEAAVKEKDDEAVEYLSKYKKEIEEHLEALAMLKFRGVSYLKLLWMRTDEYKAIYTPWQLELN